MTDALDGQGLEHYIKIESPHFLEKHSQTRACQTQSINGYCIV